MTIRNKLLFGFSLVILLAIIIAVVGMVSVRQISKKVYNISDNLFPASTQAKELVVAVWMANANFKALIFSQSSAEAKQSTDNIVLALESMKKISEFLKDKFKGNDEVIQRIKMLDSGTDRLFNLNKNVYQIVSAGLKLKQENEEIKKNTLQLVEEVVNSIAVQVDDAEFGMLLAKADSQNGIKKAITATEFMSESYNTLSQKDFPMVRRVLTMESALGKAKGLKIKISTSREMDGIATYEDEFIANINNMELRLQNIEKSRAIDQKVIDTLYSNIQKYRQVVIGKGGLKEAAIDNLKQPSETKETRLGELESDSIGIEDKIFPILAQLIDEFEFNILIGTEEANKSITEGLATTKAIEKSFSQIVDQVMPLTKALFLLRGDVAMATATVETIINNENADYIAPLEDKFIAEISSAKKQVKALKALVNSDNKEIDKLDKSVEKMEKLIIGKGGIVDSRVQFLRNLKQSEQIISEVSDHILQISALVAETVQGVSSEAQQASEATRQVVGTSTGSIGVSSFIVVVVGMTVAVFLSTIIVKNLNVLNKWVADLSGRKGDLTVRLKMKSKDELGMLGNSFDRFLDNFTDMTKIIRSSSSDIDASAKSLSVTTQQVNSSIQSISTSVQQVSKGATRQVAKVEEAFKIITAITASLKQIAQNAQEVNKSVLRVTDLAGKGKVSNQELVDKMGSIAGVVEKSAIAVGGLGKRSGQIGAIINTIDSFADQTNLLALNAAIEAARAGDAGRGFAVVAEEVRKLAEGSSKSANEISSLIEGVQNDLENVIKLINNGKIESEQGRVIAEKVSVLQSNILDATNIAEKMVSQISKVIPEQLDSSERALGAIDEVSSVAQQNASLTQEVSSSAQEMSASMEELVSSADKLADIVGHLHDLVGKFKV
ncbi:MAG: methyl-accepting chemotaxis protein [Candidatus Omnitrophica bacterium]|nr:methyl-accepting chemotaxis protein [Candidatus Omnitrophota bacterium]MBU1925605.1 methyl-accepting chemotaxis protein [Candidatus Omnitrophota bacterium]